MSVRVSLSSTRRRLKQAINAAAPSAHQRGPDALGPRVVLVALSLIVLTACGSGLDPSASTAAASSDQPTATASTRADTSDDSETTTHQSSPLPSQPMPQGEAQAVASLALALDATPPGDINLFTSVFSNGAQGIYPSGSPMVPADGPMLSEAEVRDELSSYLNTQLGTGDQVNEALALFDSEELETKIPEPMLRAAVVGLNGTVLEPTIDHGLNGDLFALIRLGSLPNLAAVAGSTGGSSNRVITVNNALASEDFRYLIGVLGHELLHDDFPNSGAEEAILGALTAMVYAQVLVNHPELAYSGTELSRQMNTFALTFLNSTERGSPDGEIFAPSGAGIAPGSPRTTPDLWAFSDGNGSSPASDAFNQVLASLGLPPATAYDQATAEAFESLNDDWMSDVERAQVSVLLEILTPQEIASAAGISEQQAIDLLGLQPYLEAAR